MQPDAGQERELARIREAYRQRQEKQELYNPARPEVAFSIRSLERNLLAMLRLNGFGDFAGKEILDVGCGNGYRLNRLLDYGAEPERLHGIDLLEERIEQGRSLYAALDLQAGNAAALPFPAGAFDLVTAYTVFSSILDDALCRQIALEMWRVRKPGGLIVWYDFIYNNPRNRAVRGISLKQARRFFAGLGRVSSIKRITLAPPIARRVVPVSWQLGNVLEALQIFNSHILLVIRD